MKRAQVAMEYLLVIGILLLIIIPLIYYSFRETQVSIENVNAYDVVNTITKAADNRELPFKTRPIKNRSYCP